MSVVLAMAMALSLCISASAAADPVIDTIQVGEYTIEILPGSPEEFMTREKVLVSAYWYEGEDEFIEEFDCVKGEGNSVNVWINNTKGNGDLVPVFYIDGDEVADSRLKLPQGEQKTYRIYNSNNGDMNNHIEVNVSSYDHHVMYFEFAARQFKYGGGLNSGGPGPVAGSAGKQIFYDGGSKL